MRTLDMRRGLWTLLLLIGCKEAPTTPIDAGSQGLEGQWAGVQSTKAGGAGHAAEVYFEKVGDNLVGVLTVSDSADAQGLALTGYFVRFGATDFRRVESFLPDGGPKESYPLGVTQTTSGHFDAIEQNVTLDGGPFPIYYRFDRK
jgi:hypothetical protein